MAEAPAAKPQYAKQVKAPAKAKRHIAKREPRKVKRVRRIVKRTTTCEPAPQMAMVPMPMPYMPPLPQQPISSTGGGVPVIIGGS
ncbi:MAG: PEP-CTERM sorting domain-containing protein, partial [Novosphingobium sp.]